MQKLLTVVQKNEQLTNAKYVQSGVRCTTITHSPIPAYAVQIVLSVPLRQLVISASLIALLPRKNIDRTLQSKSLTQTLNNRSMVNGRETALQQRNLALWNSSTWRLQSVVSSGRTQKTAKYWRISVCCNFTISIKPKSASYTKNLSKMLLTKLIKISMVTWDSSRAFLGFTTIYLEQQVKSLVKVIVSISMEMFVKKASESNSEQVSATRTKRLAFWGKWSSN